MTIHPTPEDLDGFIRATLRGEAADRVDTHLVEERCLPCLFAIRERMAQVEPELLEGVHRFVEKELYDDSQRTEGLARAMLLGERRNRVVAAEEAIAPDLLAELEPRSPADRRAAIRTIRRYQLLGFSDYLGLQSREAGFSDLARGLELAELAVVVSDTLDPQIYVAISTADARALARAFLGNARRRGSDLFGAEEAFQESLLLLKEGNKSSPVRADVWSLLGSLRIDQGRYAEARRVLDEALETYGIYGYVLEQVRVLVLLANSHGYAGNPEPAVQILERAVPLLDEVDQPRLRLEVENNLSYWMVDAGQPMEALARYQKAQPLYDEHAQAPSLRLRRRWLEGRIYAGLGDLDLARDAFEEVRTMAVDRDLAYELAMVSLELALVYLRRKETDRVRELADQMTPVFRSYELHRHALGAMYLFRQAARTDSATASFLQDILRYLQRARNNPLLRFEPVACSG